MLKLTFKQTSQLQAKPCLKTNISALKTNVISLPHSKLAKDTQFQQSKLISSQEVNHVAAARGKYVSRRPNRPATMNY